MTDAVVGYFDGLCERDPATGHRNPGGIACGGWVVVPHAGLSSAAGQGIMGSRCYGHGEGWTNNRSEYEAALDALRAIYKAGWRGPVVLYGDSKLVVEQYSGRWACNAPALYELLGQLRNAASFFASVTLRWVPRERNHDADLLSRRAYAAALRAGR